MKSIDRKMAILREKVQRLREIAARAGTFSDYQSSPDLKDLAERNLHLASEACLDVGKILIARNGLREPPDNRSVFIILAEAGVVRTESLDFLIPMAGTRNVLVHGYDHGRDADVYDVLKYRLGDFERFLSEVAERDPDFSA